jgi:hypothetical protein
MAAPVGNLNSIRHGLTSGRLPKGCKHIVRYVATLRRELESAVVQAHGEIDLTSAAYISSAVRWERHALLAQRWLCEGELDADQRLNHSREIARASTERDRCIKALNIGKDARANVFDDVYDRPLLPTPADDADDDPSKDAPDGQAERAG